VDDAQGLADQLADETARLAARLAFAIEPYEQRDHYALAAAPVAVVFARAADAGAQATHRSGRIDSALLPFLVDATQRARARLGLGDGTDNPYLIALVLAAFYVVEGARSGALGLDAVRGRTPQVAVLTGEAATRDAQAPPGGVALRVVAPVAGADGEEVGAAVELSFRPR
jgi:hypothetical protein